MRPVEAVLRWPRPARVAWRERRLPWLLRTVIAADLVFGLLLLVVAGGGRLSAFQIAAAPAVAGQTAPVAIVARFSGLTPPGQSTGLAVASDGSLVLVDRVRQVIIRLDPDGHLVSEWGPVFGPGLEARDLLGIVAEGDGWAVLDRGALRILRLDSQGKVQPDHIIDLAPLATYGPTGLAADDQGNLYVADTGLSRILVFNARGALVTSIGGGGTELGQLRQPMFLALGPDGALYVNDWENTRVERFEPRGHATGAWSLPTRAVGIAVDALGRVFVPDTDHRLVRMFAADGTLLATLGGESGAAIPLDAPSQVATSPDGARLWVLGPNGLARVDLTGFAAVRGPPAPLPVNVPLATLGAALLGVAAGATVWARTRSLLWPQTQLASTTVSAPPEAAPATRPLDGGSISAGAPRRRGRRARPRFALVVLNVVVAALWIWSRDGATTHIQVRAVGTQYRVRVDDQPLFDLEADGPRSGGITLALSGQRALPTAPAAPALRSVTVSDATTGQVLVDDDFRGAWHWQSEQVWQNGQVPSTAGAPMASISSGPQPWTDYQVDLVAQDLISLDLSIRTASDGSSAHLFVRPWRELDSGFDVHVQGRETARVAGPGLRLSPLQTARGVLGVALRPYPALLVGVLVAVLLVVLGTRVPSPLRLGWSGLRRGRAIVMAALTVAGLATGGLAYTQTAYLERIPHVPDSAIYLFQAKMFAAGLIAAPAPAAPEAFDVFTGYLVPFRGYWLSQYPFGHPLLLAIGVLLGQAWLVAPVVSGASLVLLFLLGRRMYGPAVGLLAAVLLAASPFLQMSGVDFMSHATGALYLLGSLLGLSYMLQPGGRVRTRVLGGAVSGICLGLLFNTRPLTGVPVVLVVSSFIVLTAWSKQSLWQPEILSFVLGGLLLFAAYLAYSTVLMGSPFDNPYRLSGTFSPDNLGFGGHLTIERAWSNVYTQITLLDSVLVPWQPGLAFLPVLLTFLLDTRNRWDYLLAGTSLAVVVAWFFYIAPMIMYGPRFWYEFTPLLALLAARGVSLATSRAHGLARRLRPTSLAEQCVMPVALVLVSICVGLNVRTWWGPPDAGRVTYPFVPLNVEDLRGFNFTDARIVAAVQAAGVHNAVVLVADDCTGWWCYGSVFSENDPLLQGDIVFARDRGVAGVSQLRALYPTRAFYELSYNHQPVSLQPLGRTS